MPRTRLTNIRRIAGFTQRTLGVAVGVSNVSVCFWETGRARPHPRHGAILASVLGEPVDDLLRWEDEPT